MINTLVSYYIQLFSFFKVVYAIFFIFLQWGGLHEKKTDLQKQIRLIF